MISPCAGGSHHGMKTWQQRFGAIRRAIDRKILLECERSLSPADITQLELEAEREAARAAEPDSAALEQREAIARAFGRPVQ